VLVMTSERRRRTVTAVDLLVLAPWLVFVAGLAVLGYRLLTHSGRSRRHSR